MTQRFGRITANLDVIYPRYDPAAFVGREWLFKKLEAWRDAPAARQLVIVGEPGAGKSAILAYLAEAWNCPRHFIRADNLSGIAGLDPKACLLSLGTQLFQKYGSEIFEGAQAGATTVTVGLAKDKAEIVGRLIEELHTPLPFLPPHEVKVRVGVAAGEARVVGERVRKLVNTAWDLPESALLHVALLQPLQRLSHLQPEEKVVVLVDALDESWQHKGVTILDALPRPADANLPPNLRLLMTSRPSAEILAGFQPSDLLRLDDEPHGWSKHNRRDAHRYVQQRLAQPPLADALAAMDPSKAEAFVERVDRGAEANFLFLYYYLNALQEAAAGGALDLESLPVPAGLDEIYRFFAVQRIRRQTLGRVRFTVRAEGAERLVARLRSDPGVEAVSLADRDVTLIVKDVDAAVEQSFSRAFELGLPLSSLKTEPGEDEATWAQKYLPVLGALAVAQEAISLTLLAKLAGVEVEYAGIVITHLRQFLDEVPGPGESGYRLYHSSFREYLIDPRRNQDYPLEAARYHARVADYYRSGASGWHAVDWKRYLDQPYPFRHLPLHLSRAGLADDLLRLLTATPAWMEAQAQATRGDAAYRSAVDLAISGLTDPLTPANLVALATLYAARHVVSERVSNYSDADLELLVCLDRAEEALATARLRPTLRDRFQGLRVIAAALQAAQRGEPDVYPELLELMRGSADANERSDLAIALAAQLVPSDSRRADETIGQALEAGLSLTDPEDADDKLAALAVSLSPAGLPDRAISVVTQIRTDWKRTHALQRAAEASGESGRLDQAHALVMAIEDDFDRQAALHTLALTHLRRGELEQAYELAGSIHEAEWAAEVFGQLALAFHEAGDAREVRVLEEALRRVETVENEWRRAEALARLAAVLGQLHDPRAQPAFDRALAFLLPTRDTAYLVRAIGSIAAASFFERAFHVVIELPPGGQGRKEALGEISLALAQQARFSEAVQVAAVMNRLGPGHFNDNAYLNQLGHRLADAGRLEDALQVVQWIDRVDSRYSPLIALAVWLVGHEQKEPVEALIAFVQQDWDGQHQLTREFNRLMSELPVDGPRTHDTPEPDDRRRLTKPLTDLAAALAEAAGRRDHWAFELALSVGRAIPEGWERAEALRRLALQLARWNAAGVAELFEEAQAAERSWARFYARRTVRLQYLGQRLAAAGDFDLAQRLAQSIAEGRARDFMRRDLAIAMAQAGQLDRAEGVITTIEEQSYQHAALMELALAALKAGQARAAALLEQVLQTLPPPDFLGLPSRSFKQLIEALLHMGRLELAGALAQAGRFEEAGLAQHPLVKDKLAGLEEELLQGRAPARAAGQSEPPPDARALEEDPQHWGEVLVPIYLQAGWHDRAWQLIQKLTDERGRSRLASQLASDLIRLERYEQVAQTLSAMQPWDQQRTLVEAIVDRAVLRGFKAETPPIQIDGLEAIQPIVTAAWQQANELDRLGTGGDDVAWEKLNRWQATLLSLPLVTPRSFYAEDDVITLHERDDRQNLYRQGLEVLVRALLRERRYDEAIEALRTAEAVLYRDPALLTLTNGLAAAGRLDEAAAFVEEIHNDDQRREAVEALGRRLVEAQCFARAVGVCRPRHLDDYLETLQGWIPALESLQAGLAGQVIAQATRVAGWTQPDWDDVHQALAEAASAV